MDKWPERLSIRDTKIYDDLGGLGQRIFTTAGAAYEKHTYYSEEYVSAKQARIEALENDFAYHSELCTIQQARIEALEAMWSVVFDGNEVLRYLNYEAKQRLAGKDVSDVLDAVNRAGKLRARKPAALLESEPTAHTCNASCQRPACVLRRRVEGAVVTPPILRIEK